MTQKFKNAVLVFLDALVQTFNWLTYPFTRSSRSDRSANSARMRGPDEIDAQPTCCNPRPAQNSAGTPTAADALRVLHEFLPDWGYPDHVVAAISLEIKARLQFPETDGLIASATITAPAELFFELKYKVETLTREQARHMYGEMGDLVVELIESVQFPETG